jgi:hypothetical protein
MSLLTNLNEVLNEKRPDYLNILAPGINAEDIKAIIKQQGLNIDLPEQAIAWFGWKNGIDDEAFRSSNRNLDENLEAFLAPLSLLQSIQCYLQETEIGFYSKLLFPLLTNGGGNINAFVEWETGIYTILF